MDRMELTRTIAAPIDRVFNAVADISQFSKALPHIVKVEFLSAQKSGLGARFRETRLMKGKEYENELEVTEYVANQRVRLVADTHGTVWDTLFTVKSAGDKTVLTMTMDTRSKKVISALMVFLISGMVKKAIAKDLELVKAYCEQASL